MIGRDVQRSADVRAKGFSGFQLEARELQDVPLRVVRGSDHRSRRCADVAAHLHGNAARFQNMTGQRGCGGLAV